jgi:hypothetical protein
MIADSITRLRDSISHLDDPPALRAAAAEQGYLFFRRLSDPADALALKSLILEDAPPFGGYDDPRWIALQCRVHPSGEFHRLQTNQDIRRVLEILLEGPVRGDRGDTCRVFSPRTPELTTLPHQDRHYVPGDGPLWTVWIPLGDCPLELGGVAVLSGSHRGGLRIHTGEQAGARTVEVSPDAEWSGEDYRCGDVLLFNGWTIHRALENRTDRCRFSADFRYDREPIMNSGSKEQLRVLR